MHGPSPGTPTPASLALAVALAAGGGGTASLALWAVQAASDPMARAVTAQAAMHIKMASNLSSWTDLRGAPRLSARAPQRQPRCAWAAWAYALCAEEQRPRRLGRMRRRAEPEATVARNHTSQRLLASRSLLHSSAPRRHRRHGGFGGSNLPWRFACVQRGSQGYRSDQRRR